MLAPVLSPDRAIRILLLNLQKRMANLLRFFGFFPPFSFSDQQGSTASLISDAFLEVAILVNLELGSFLSH